MAILGGTVGTLGNMIALMSYSQTCFREMSSTTSDNITITDKRAGAAVLLIFAGTMLRVLDVAAHLVVPVPERGHWTPDGPYGDESDAKISRSDDVVISSVHSAVYHKLLDEEEEA